MGKMGKVIVLLGIQLILVVAPAMGANPFLTTGDSAPPTTFNGTPAPQFLVDLQTTFRTATGDLIDQLKTGASLPLVLSLMGAAFLYGFLHALAPGHLKTVVFSLFLGRKEPGWKPLAAGFLTTGVHAGSSLLLIGVLSLIHQGVAQWAKVDVGDQWVKWVAAQALVVLALVLVIRKIVHLVKHHGHTHGIKVEKGSMWLVLTAASVIPCSGATVLLLMTLYADLLWLGVLGVVALSFGMGLVVSASGYLAWAGRSALFERLKGREGLVHGITEGVELFSYVLLLVLALLIVL